MAGRSTTTASSRNSARAVTLREGDPDIWTYDLDRGIKTRFTFDPDVEDIGAWTPSGGEVTYALHRDGKVDILSKPSSGAGEAKLLVDTPSRERAPDWSPDQKYLIYELLTPDAQRDLVYRQRRPDGALGGAVTYLKTPFDESAPRFSPDGHFVAYQSNESGRYEVYVRAFPNGAKWQVSAHGGGMPRWRRDGKEIFYIEGRKVMTAPVVSHPAFSPGASAMLFELPSVPGAFPEYDVTADGKRFILRQKPDDEPPLAIHVVHNWFEEFRRRQ